MARTFGIELEVKGTRNNIRAAMTASGVPFVYEGYTHATRSHWKIVTDSSVHGGYEVVSPILSGEAGFEAVKRVCDALSAHDGVKVDKECGFHVHVGVGGVTKEAFGRIAKNFIFAEPFFDSVVAPSRQSSVWAESNWKFITTDHTPEGHKDAYNRIFERIDAARDHAAVTHACTSGRYHKLNLTAFWRHQTVEFRQHQGTTDAAKVINWVKVCVGLVEVSINGRPRKITKGYNASQVRSMIFRMIGVEREVSEFFKARAKHFARAA